MPEYLAYVVFTPDHAGSFLIAAFDDQEAINRAKTNHRDAAKIELWKGNRMVARLGEEAKK